MFFESLLLEFQSGAIYKGSYKGNQKQGYGEMFYPDGSVYK